MRRKARIKARPPVTLPLYSCHAMAYLRVGLIITSLR